MDKFTELPGEEKRVYFEQVPVRLGYLTPQLVEKDFWVCWTLRRLFELDEFKEHLTFKGGTSLSKVYSLIDRFSEDIDLSIDREFLGFGGDQEPEAGQSGKEQQRRIEKLKTACQQAIQERLLPELKQAFASLLNSNAPWELTLDQDDPDQQTILFKYPASISTGLAPYIAPSVRIELGARSDHFPVEQNTIVPYLADAIPEAMRDSETSIQNLCAERTFWEKATILHSIYHRAKSKNLPPRMSRHYYDLYKMTDSEIVESALSKINLLDRVAQHKSVFFKSAGARYDLACPGTLKLVPAAERVAELKRDYQSMQPMFFKAAPDFETIVTVLRELELRINSIQ